MTIKDLDGHLLTLTHSNITDKDFKINKNFKGLLIFNICS